MQPLRLKLSVTSSFVLWVPAWFPTSRGPLEHSVDGFLEIKPTGEEQSSAVRTVNQVDGGPDGWMMNCTLLIWTRPDPSLQGGLVKEGAQWRELGFRARYH